MKVHPAGVQDRGGAAEAIEAALKQAPALARTFADGGCSGPKLQARLREAGLPKDLIQVVEKPRDAKGLAVSPSAGGGADLRPDGPPPHR